MPNRGQIDGNRSEWGFSEILNWHLDRGTRPADGPESFGKRWSNKEFAHATRTTDRTVRNWRTAVTLPTGTNEIEQALFGGNRDYAQWRIEIRTAFGRGNRTPKDFDRFRQKPSDEARLTIEDFQVFTVETPLIAGASLVSLSIFLGANHNRVRPLEDLFTVGGLVDLRFEPANGFEALLEHITADAPLSLREQLNDSIRFAIDRQSAILYSGSVNPANTAQLSKLPAVLKGFAGLSPRQFRVGLFRLSATIIVVGVSGGLSTYTAYQGAKYLHEIMSKAIPAVSAREH